MEIIDTQLHEHGPWLTWDDPLRNAVAVECVLAAMDAAGVDAAVLSLRDDLAEFAATSFPERFASFSTAPDPTMAGLEEYIGGIRRRPGVLAIKVVSIHKEQIEMMKQGAFDPIFSAAQKHSVPICMLAWGALPVVHDVVRRFGDLNLAIQHLGLPQPPFFRPDDPPFKNLPDLLDFARYPNVSLQFSSAPSLSREAFPFNDVWPSLMRIIEAFTPERLMWASDFTRVHNRRGDGEPYGPESTRFGYVGKHTYGEAVAFLKETDRLSEADKELIFGASLRRIMGWPKAQ